MEFQTLNDLQLYHHNEFINQISKLSDDVLEEYLNTKSTDQLNGILLQYDNSLKLIKKLVECGADPHYRNDIAFINACESCSKLDIIEFLLEVGIDINTQNGIALTIMMRCLDKNCVNRNIKFLLENGIKITNDMIITACKKKSPQVLKLFLEYDADQNMILKHLLINHSSDDDSKFIECLQVVNEYDPNYELVVNKN